MLNNISPKPGNVFHNPLRQAAQASRGGSARVDSSQSSRGEEAGCQETGRPEECLEAAWPCACGETFQVRSRLVARNSELQKVVLGIAGLRLLQAPLAG